MNVSAIMTAIYASADQRKYTQRVADCFSELNGIPVRVLQNSDFAGEFLSSAHFARYYGWQFVSPETEKLIYLDADILPLRPLPPLPDVDFAAAPDHEGTCDKARNNFPILKRVHDYFNSGFFIAGRKTEPLFQSVLDRQSHAGGMAEPWYKDQTLLNIEIQLAVKNGDLTFEMLPKSWNYLAISDSVVVQDPYMLHLTGVKNSNATKLAHYIINHFDRLKGKK